MCFWCFFCGFFPSTLTKIFADAQFFPSKSKLDNFSLFFAIIIAPSLVSDRTTSLDVSYQRRTTEPCVETKFGSQRIMVVLLHLYSSARTTEIRSRDQSQGGGFSPPNQRHIIPQIASSYSDLKNRELMHQKLNLLTNCFPVSNNVSLVNRTERLQHYNGDKTVLLLSFW